MPEARISRVAQAGNIFAEYGLISLLILGCAVLALQTLGSGLSGVLGDMIRFKRDSSVQVASSQKGIAATSQIYGGATVRMTLSNGSRIEFSSYPQDLATSIRTVGANGTTTMLAEVLRNMGTELLANKTISEEGYNHLTALSNQAHYIASIEKALEEAAAKASSSQEFSSNPIEFNGKTYSAQELRMLIGYGSGTNDTSVIFDHMTEPRAYPAVKKFQKLYQQALESGTLDDPAAFQVVKSLSNQVAYLSDVATSASAKIIQQEIPPSDMRHSMTGDVTHAKSKGICHTGSGQDTGIQCVN